MKYTKGRDDMLKPFNTIKEKVDFVLKVLEVYCDDENVKLACAKESILGEAIVMSNTKQDIPVVFGDIITQYATNGYDMSNLKDFLIELYEEYCPRKRIVKITQKELQEDIKYGLFEFVKRFLTIVQNDIILSKFIIDYSPNLYEKIDRNANAWLTGIEVDDDKIYPILNYPIMFRCPSSSLMRDTIYTQAIARLSSVIKECEFFESKGDFNKDPVLGNMCVRCILKTTENLQAQVEVVCYDTPVDTTTIPVEKSNRGICVSIKYSLIPK